MLWLNLVWTETEPWYKIELHCETDRTYWLHLSAICGSKVVLLTFYSPFTAALHKATLPSSLFCQPCRGQASCLNKLFWTFLNCHWKKKKQPKKLGGSMKFTMLWFLWYVQSEQRGCRFLQCKKRKSVNIIEKKKIWNTLIDNGVPLDVWPWEPWWLETAHTCTTNTEQSVFLWNNF